MFPHAAMGDDDDKDNGNDGGHRAAQPSRGSPGRSRLRQAAPFRLLQPHTGFTNTPKTAPRSCRPVCPSLRARPSLTSLKSGSTGWCHHACLSLCPQNFLFTAELACMPQRSHQTFSVSILNFPPSSWQARVRPGGAPTSLSLSSSSLGFPFYIHRDNHQERVATSSTSISGASAPDSAPSAPHQVAVLQAPETQHAFK